MLIRHVAFPPKSHREQYFFLPQTSGIYCITCTATGEQYVGRATNIRKRAQVHLIHLAGEGAHASRKLREAVAKHGIGSLVFSVLREGVSTEEEEMKWLDQLKPALNTFGMHPKAPRPQTFIEKLGLTPPKTVRILLRDVISGKTKTLTVYGEELADLENSIRALQQPIKPIC